MRNSIRRTALILLALLLILVIYISYLQVIVGPQLAANPLNRRSAELEKTVQRGAIVDRHGTALAFSTYSDRGYQRNYPQGRVFAAVTGYDSETLGRTGLEGAMNGYLSGTFNPERQFGAISHFFSGKTGDDVIITIDAALQQVAYNALGAQRGAVVVIEPQTGQILAMVSKPGYDPNQIERQWSALHTANNGALVNRAVQGSYPPGSTFKVLTAAAALEDKVVSPTTTFHCSGELKIGPDYVLPEIGHIAHGTLDLQQALAVSCNVTYGQVALRLGRDRFAQAFDRFGLTKQLSFTLPGDAPRVPNFSRLTDGELAQVGIGQGPLSLSPLRMAMLAATIANCGKTMQPYLVSRIQDHNGKVIREFAPQVWLTPLSADTATMVRHMMETVVREGTGRRAQMNGIAVAGKTGTAENPHGAAHAWFIGFAPADNPRLAIAVIVENAGEGGTVAAPIARQIFAEALR